MTTLNLPHPVSGHTTPAGTPTGTAVDRMNRLAARISALTVTEQVILIRFCRIDGQQRDHVADLVNEVPPVWRALLTAAFVRTGLDINWVRRMNEQEILLAEDGGLFRRAVSVQTCVQAALLDCLTSTLPVRTEPELDGKHPAGDQPGSLADGVRILHRALEFFDQHRTHPDLIDTLLLLCREAPGTPGELLTAAAALLHEPEQPTGTVTPDDLYGVLADALAAISTTVPSSDWLADLIHDALADTCPGFTTGEPNQNWLRRARQTNSGADAQEAATRIAGALADLNGHVNVDALEWLTGRLHDALADAVPGFAAGRPNAAWLATARRP